MSKASDENSRIDLIVTHEKLVLSNRDRDLFISVMQNPPQLKGKLKDTIRKYREKYGK